MPSEIPTNFFHAVAVAAVVPMGLHPRVFPAGTEALHAEHGWVLVEQAIDNERLVRWYGFRDVPESAFSELFDADGDPVIAEQEITTHRQWVSFRSLRRIADPNGSRSENWQRLKQVGALRLPIEVVARYVRPASALDLPSEVIGVTACNRNRLCSQSARFPARIICE